MGVERTQMDGIGRGGQCTNTHAARGEEREREEGGGEKSTQTKKQGGRAPPPCAHTDQTHKTHKRAQRSVVLLSAGTRAVSSSAAASKRRSLREFGGLRLRTAEQPSLRAQICMKGSKSMPQCGDANSSEAAGADKKGKRPSRQTDKRDRHTHTHTKLCIEREGGFSQNRRWVICVARAAAAAQGSRRRRPAVLCFVLYVYCGFLLLSTRRRRQAHSTQHTVLRAHCTRWRKGGGAKSHCVRACATACGKNKGECRAPSV